MDIPMDTEVISSSGSALRPTASAPAHHQVFSTLRIALQSAQQASNIKQCLEVDEELQPTKISKSYETDNNVLLV
jgi:hypothetical protein